MMKNRRSFITGIKSIKLTSKEKFFLNKYKPWGIILFSRNIKSLNQSKKLTDEIKKIFKDNKYPILIDEEGGRVNRLNALIDTSFFTAEFFGKLYKKDINKFNLYFNIYINKISLILNKIGININTVPVLDIKVKKTSKIIGDRSYSSIPKTVSNIGNICIDNFHKNKIGTVVKHIPGHGLAMVDSHKFTPIVKESRKVLFKKHFYTFKNKKSLFAMTAHIIYSAIDKKFTATHSKKIISLIRNKIKFKN